MRIKALILLIACALIASSCSGDLDVINRESNPPPVTETPKAPSGAPVTPPASAERNGEPEDTMLTDEPAAPPFSLDGAKISPLHPIIFDGFLLGGFDGSAWVDPDSLGMRLRGGELYKLYSKTDHIGYGTGYVKPYDPADGPYSGYASIHTDVSEDGYAAISCDWDCLPRKPVERPLQDEEGLKVVEDILAGFGLSDPVLNIIQNYRIDLDGDGMDEGIIYAEYSRQDDDSGYHYRFTTQTGDYSLALMQKVVNGKVEIFVIDSDVHIQTTTAEEPEYSRRYIFEICGFYDFNGDGNMEILTCWSAYEGFGYDIWAVSDNGVRRIGSSSMGA